VQQSLIAPNHIISVANFWQMISAKSAEKFGRWQKNLAADIIFF
jgi:hypothetical protein